MSGVASFAFSMWEHVRGKKIESRAFFAVGVICLIVAFDQAWQDEHRNSEVVIAEKRAAVSEKDFWKDQSYAKDGALRSLNQLLGQNYSVLANTQSSLANLSNRLMDVTGPTPRKIDVMVWKIPETYTYANVGKVQFWTLLVITNREIIPVKGDLICDADFTVGAENILTHGTSLQADFTVNSPRSIHVEFAYPPMSAEHPLAFFAFTKAGTDMHECTFTRD